jgi:hypothetical protein
MATNSPPIIWSSRPRYPLALPTVRGGACRCIAPSTFHGGVIQVWRVRCDPATAGDGHDRATHACRLHFYKPDTPNEVAISNWIGSSGHLAPGVLTQPHHLNSQYRKHVAVHTRLEGLGSKLTPVGLKMGAHSLT